jgi:hypothetical protein
VPSVDLQVTLFSDDGTRSELLSEIWSPDPEGATPFSTVVAASSLAPGDDLGVTVKTEAGETLFETTTSYSP